MIDVDNGSTSDVCIFKHHLLRHGFAQITFLCKLVVYIYMYIFVVASLIYLHSLQGSHSLLGPNDFREVISSRGESLAPSSE